MSSSSSSSPSARRAPPRFRGPAADSQLGEALIDSIGIVSAVGFAADVSQCAQLCGTTFRAGNRGATNDMLVQSLRLQSGAREARKAEREQFVAPLPFGMPLTIEGSTRLIRAAILNDLPRVLQLIQLGAPLDLVDETWESSALNWASYLGYEHVAKALLDGKYAGRGATLDLRDKFGHTALSRASNMGHEAIVRLLLSRGADQRLQCNDGKTPLHVAVIGNCIGVIELLCAAPGAAAALALEDHLGLSPLALAVSNGCSTCEAVLRAHGAPW